MNNIIDFYRGFILTHPYGTYVRNRSKTLIIKSRSMPSIVHKPLLLIENKLALGLIELSGSKEINLEQFAHLEPYHRIPKSDREEWWGGYDKLYAYTILKTKFFKIPILISYPTGPQITIQPQNIWLRNIFIGTSGLGGIKFGSYAKILNSVEINYTWYRKPTPTFITNLSKYKLTYTIKVTKLITHYKQLNNVKEIWKQFYSSFEILSHQVICFLFQFSPKFIFNENNLEKLSKLSSYVKGPHIFAFEFRDRMWSNNAIDELFEKNKWTLVISHVINVDGWAGNLKSGFNPKLSTYKPTNSIYFRLHGTSGQYTGSYTDDFLRKLVEFIRLRPTIKNVLIYFNNTDSSDALINAQSLQSRFNYLNVHYLSSSQHTQLKL